MAIDMTSLYDFRISTDNGKTFSNVPSRSRLVKRMASAINQGVDVKILKAEKRTSGNWDSDPAAFTLLRKRLEEKANGQETASSNGATPTVKITPKKAASKLAGIAKLTAAADSISSGHVDAVTEAYNNFLAALEAEEAAEDESEPDDEEAE